MFTGVPDVDVERVIGLTDGIEIELAAAIGVGRIAGAGFPSL
jgi:hypothetical protein